MDMRELSGGVFAAGQINPGDIAEAKAAGITTVICNRPDGEGWLQPTSADIRQAAEAEGMSFHYLPLAPGGMTQDLIDGMAKALDGADGKVLAYCRSGNRSANLWALAKAPEIAPGDLLRAAANAGYDLSGIAPMLEARHGR